MLCLAIMLVVQFYLFNSLQPVLILFHRMTKKYGSILRFYFMFGRERLLVADPQMMKHIFVTNCRNYVKPNQRFR
jgi:hypothetical protein